MQVVKSLLDFKDEQLAVQMDSHDSLWGETGTFLLLLRQILAFALRLFASHLDSKLVCSGSKVGTHEF